MSIIMVYDNCTTKIVYGHSLWFSAMNVGLLSLSSEGNEQEVQCLFQDLH